jgi:hypothetical protein
MGLRLTAGRFSLLFAGLQIYVLCEIKIISVCWLQVYSDANYGETDHLE